MFILPGSIIYAILKDIYDQLLVKRIRQRVNGGMCLDKVVNQLHFGILNRVGRFQGL